jgi:hypothetical protein
MAFVLETLPGTYGWPLIVDKAAGITVTYRGPQPDGVPNIYVQMSDGMFEAVVFDDTKMAGKPELDVVWTVQSIRAKDVKAVKPGMRDEVMAALKESLEALSFRKQAIKMKELPVVKSVTVDFGKTVWG